MSKIAITERAILFNTPMVRALIDGRKTQARRVMKLQPSEYKGGVHPDNVNNARNVDAPYFDAYCGERRTSQNPRGMGLHWCWWTEDHRQGIDWIRCPYGKVGDRLYVCEAFIQGYEYDDNGRKQVCDADGNSLPPKTWYRATDDITWTDDNGWCLDNVPWKSGAQMPKHLSRITLEITGIRVERLQEISSLDALAEGVNERDESDFPDPIGSYAALWDEINGKGAWDENAWVWRIEFRVLEGGK